MRTWFRKLRRAATRPNRLPPRRLALESLDSRCLPSTAQGFVTTNLVSNVPGLAAHTDPNLVNPWGFTLNAQGQFLISNNHSGTASLVAADGSQQAKPITIPSPSQNEATSSPNGQIVNTTSDFVFSKGDRKAPATILFSTEDGTIAAFNPNVDPRSAVIVADQSSSEAIYKLLDMGSAGGANYLYATDFHNGKVDVFDAKFGLHTFFQGQFTDPNAPAGYAPFGIHNFGGVLFVTFAKQDEDGEDDASGPGNGFIDRFDTSGHFLGRFATGASVGGPLKELNSPIGMTMAPAGFGRFGGALLVGNFGDSHVNAFNMKTGRFLGQLQDAAGRPLVLANTSSSSDSAETEGLWGIAFGNGRGGAGANTLFFASGINDEEDGLFGMVNVAPSSGSATEGRAASPQVFMPSDPTDNDDFSPGARPTTRSGSRRK